MKKYILFLLVVVGLIGRVDAQTVNYSSRPHYSWVTSTVETNASISSYYQSEPFGGGDYINTISYSALSSGAVLSIYLPDTFHVYGPYSFDSWSMGVASGGSVPFTLNGASSGGSFEVYTQSAVTDASIASVPEPSTYALFGLGLVTLLAVRRKRLC